MIPALTENLEKKPESQNQSNFWQEVDVVLVGLKTERRLDAVIFMSSEPSESAKSISLSKCLKYRTIAFFITFFMWTKLMVMKVPVEVTKCRGNVKLLWNQQR